MENLTIIKVALLAYGMSGRIFHAPYIHAHQNFNLYAVLERNQKKAHLDYPDVKSYSDIELLLNDTSIDLVVVNTPSYLHFEHIKKVLLSNKHVLAEKPFTTTVDEAKVLFDLADRVGKKIFFYQNRRFNSDYISVRKVLEAGVLGRLVEVHFRMDRFRNTIGPKQFKESPMPGSGLLYDLGSHLIDQAIDLFGKPLRHHKILRKNRDNSQVDDYFTITLEYEQNLLVFLTASMLVVNPQTAYVIHGSNGTYLKEKCDSQEEQLLAGINFSDAKFGCESKGSEGILSILNEKGNTIQSKVESEKGNYIVIFDAIYQNLINGVAYPITREEILWQLQILEN